jgi:acetyl esterase/lipase
MKHIQSLAVVGLLASLGALGIAQNTGAAQAKPGDVLELRSIGRLEPAQVRRQIASLFSNAGIPSTPYAVRRYRIRIATRDLQNRPTSVAAILDVPVRGASARPSIMVIGAGTTGVADQCAPSKEQPRLQLWGDYPAANLAYASAGYVAITPDYLFFDDPQRLQPYFVSKAEAQIMLDAARAVRGLALNGRLGVTPANSVFMSGYSQGGHAAFAGADYQSRYASDVPLKGVIGFGTTSDVGGLMRQDARFAPYIMASYRQTYGKSIERDEVLVQRSLENFDRNMANRCVDAISTYYPTQATRAYREDFRKDLLAFSLSEDFPALARALTENNAGFHQSAQDIPGLLVQGSADTIVTNAQQRAFANRMCALNRRVRYSEYRGVPHTQTRQFGFRESINWMNAIINGQTAPSSCR